jgi:hypothetical protein
VGAGTAAEAYIEAAKAHGDASEKGDHESANAQHDLIVQALRVLRSTPGGEGQALRSMLTHEDLHVRCWAATHFLRVDPEEAIAVLDGLTSARGVVGLNAKMVLSEWRKGRLELP